MDDELRRRTTVQFVPHHFVGFNTRHPFSTLRLRTDIIYLSTCSVEYTQNYLVQKALCSLEWGSKIPPILFLLYLLVSFIHGVRWEISESVSLFGLLL